MHLQHLLLPAQDPQASIRFYRDVLQLPLIDGAIQAGWSRIRLQPATQAVGCVHLAFNVAYARFEAAVAWLTQRLPLLSDDNGRTRFALDGNWQSQSVYFAGPDASVLELIARRPLGLQGGIEGEFHGSEIQCLSEVGLPCADVTKVTSHLGRHFGAAPLSPATEEFAAVGDHEGLLILVAPPRRWFPQGRQVPWAVGLQLTVQTTYPTARLLDAQGWQLLASA